MGQAVRLRARKDYRDLGCRAGSVVTVSADMARFLLENHPDCFEPVDPADKALTAATDKMLRGREAMTK